LNGSNFGWWKSKSIPPTGRDGGGQVAIKMHPTHGERWWWTGEILERQNSEKSNGLKIRKFPVIYSGFFCQYN